MEKYWSDLIYDACGKDPVKMRELVKFDVIEFFGFLEHYMKGE